MSLREVGTSPAVGHLVYKVRFGRSRRQGGPSVITGELKNKVDRVWDQFWSGGISNPLQVIEQITYLLFIRRLDDLNILAEKKAQRTGKTEGIVFGPDQQDMRWSVFKNDEPGLMFTTVEQKVFPFLRALGGDGSTYGEHMKDARFAIPTPQLLSRVVDMLDDIPMADRDTTGDLYEYLLAKIASAGVNGQFRTPRHIITLMVDMVAPQPADEICDPAVMRNFCVSRDDLSATGARPACVSRFTAIDCWPPYDTDLPAEPRPSKSRRRLRPERPFAVRNQALPSRGLARMQGRGATPGDARVHVQGRTQRAMAGVAWSPSESAPGRLEGSTPICCRGQRLPQSQG